MMFGNKISGTVRGNEPVFYFLDYPNMVSIIMVRSAACLFKLLQVLLNLLLVMGLLTIC